jgi:hypothetical protein
MSLAMAEQSPPYWRLLSVLFSSQPLTEALAMSLFHVALDLHRRDASAGEVQGTLAQGQVRNLRQHVLLGSLGGPSFEARVETERGSGTVRFFLTREALQLLEAQAPAQRPPFLN